MSLTALQSSVDSVESCQSLPYSFLFFTGIVICDTIPASNHVRHDLSSVISAAFPAEGYTRLGGILFRVLWIPILL